MVIAREDSIGLIYRNRRAALDCDTLAHYLATVSFRGRAYDIRLMSEEVVLASVNGSLLVSHPQSEIWLEQRAVRKLLAVYHSGKVHPDPAIPEWLTCSSSAGSLLLSDQRSGRWVLLGRDHMAEFERRASTLMPIADSEVSAPPVISMKGVDVHMQSAFRLARALRHFGESRQVSAYEEAAPEFRLRVAAATEGIQVSDTNTRAGMAAREATKWASIIEAELVRLNAIEIARGQITTVLAGAPGGRFVLQWGDEVFVPDGFWNETSGSDRLIYTSSDGLAVLLDVARSAGVALTAEETAVLRDDSDGVRD